MAHTPNRTHTKPTDAHQTNGGGNWWRVEMVELFSIDFNSWQTNSLCSAHLSAQLSLRSALSAQLIRKLGGPAPTTSFRCVDEILAVAANSHDIFLLNYNYSTSFRLFPLLSKTFMWPHAEAYLLLSQVLFPKFFLSSFPIKAQDRFRLFTTVYTHKTTTGFVAWRTNALTMRWLWFCRVCLQKCLHRSVCRNVCHHPIYFTPTTLIFSWLMARQNSSQIPGQ